MEKIQDALEKEITRGNCITCQRRIKDPLAKRLKLESDRFYCNVTEKAIGSGEEYCELT